MIRGAPSKYVIVNYHDKYADRVHDELEIDDDDVIRAKNRKYFLWDEVMKCRTKYTHRSPTYGICDYCLSVGPINLLCQMCPNDHYSTFYGGTCVTMPNETIIGWIVKT